MLILIIAKKLVALISPFAFDGPSARKIKLAIVITVGPRFSDILGGKVFVTKSGCH